MKNIITHVLVSIGVAFLLTKLQEIVNSQYLTSFLKLNLITIIIALMAINTTTLGIVLSKIRDLTDDYNKFQGTKKQMSIAIIEQITLISISMIFFIILDSEFISVYNNIKSLFDVLCISIFIYDLMILYDMSKSVFVIINFDKRS